MPYLIDRRRAFSTDDLIAIVRSRQHRMHSRVILKDNSLYQTLTRPRMFLRRAQQHSGAIIRICTGRRSRRT